MRVVLALLPLLAGCIQEPALWITRSGDGRGDVTSMPRGIECGTRCGMLVERGVQVVLVAAPLSDARFAGWEGGGCAGTGPCTPDLIDDTTVDARFELVAAP